MAFSKAGKGASYVGRLFSCCILTTIAAPEIARAETPEIPVNIVVVMTDDHAQWALGAYGLDAIDTPNIDWLAREGVLFENAMSPAPVCSPARASFHTGRLPSQHGVHDFLSESPEFDANWLDGETLLGERLQALGYRTALVGKWHATTDSRPPQRGYGRWLSYDPLEAGWQNQYLHSGTVRFSDQGEAREHTGVQAEFLTTAVIDFIDAGPAVDPTPFFISLNYTEPHAPFEGLPERLVSRYRPIAQRLAPAGDTSALADRGEHTRVPDDHAEQLAQYLAAIALIDEQVGRIVDALASRGLLDHTLLVFVSDHGLLMGDYGLYGKTNATSPPNFYEETIRIPLVIRAPGMRPAQRRREFVDLLDLHETVLDYAQGGQLQTPPDRPGRSLRALIEGERNAGWRTLQFAERANFRMATDGRFKLVREYARGGRAVTDTWYDLAHPLGERRAVSAPRAAIAGALGDALEAYFTGFETESKSGRRAWDQPVPNPRLRDDLAAY